MMPFQSDFLVNLLSKGFVFLFIQMYLGR